MTIVWRIAFWVEVFGDSALIFDWERRESHVFNRSAYEIFSRAETPISDADLTDRVQQIAAEHPNVRADVMDFIDVALARGLFVELAQTGS